MVTLRWHHLLLFLSFLSLSLAAGRYQTPTFRVSTSPSYHLTTAQHRRLSANAPVSPTAPSSLYRAPLLIAKHLPASHLRSSLIEPTLGRKRLRRIALALVPTVPSNFVCHIICLYALRQKRRTFLQPASRGTVSKMRRSCFCSSEQR